MRRTKRNGARVEEDQAAAGAAGWSPAEGHPGAGWRDRAQGDAAPGVSRLAQGRLRQPVEPKVSNTLVTASRRRPGWPSGRSRWRSGDGAGARSKKRTRPGQRGEVLTQPRRLKGGGRAALASAFTVDGGHLDLVGGLWLQANDGEGGGVCQGGDCRRGGEVEIVYKEVVGGASDWWMETF